MKDALKQHDLPRIGRASLRMMLVCSLVLWGLSQSCVIMAVESETRIPEGVWMSNIRLTVTPEYSRAFGPFGSIKPLWELVIRNSELKNQLSGELKREELKTEFSLGYGLTESWMTELTIPFTRKTQSSALALDNSASSSDLWARTLKNLPSETHSGLDDIKLKAGYEMTSSTKWFTRAGVQMLLPTGRTGTPRGVYASSVGEGHGSLGGFFHFNWYPFIRGLRNSFRFSGTHPLIGKRENLEGERGYYAPGNLLEVHYNWSYEHSNYFSGFELHHQEKLESRLLNGQRNQSYLDEVELEFGWGNLNDLEERALPLPWQMRFGYVKPIRGGNAIFAPRLHFSWLLFF